MISPRASTERRGKAKKAPLRARYSDVVHEVKEIAAAGQAEVLTKHRYADRAREIANALAQNRGERYRTTDEDEILRAYALFHAQRYRLDLILRSFVRARCSLSTRAYLGARCVKTMINTLRS